MSDAPRYPFYGALAKGLGAPPETITRSGRASVGKMVFTNNLAAGDTFTINGVEFTANASAGAPAVGKIVFTGNLIATDTVVINGVTFTCMASGAAGELQFDVGGSLSLSLDALITKLNACTDVRVSIATYSKTDTNTAVTVTFDTNSTAHNSIAIGSTHSTVVVTQPNGGVNNATAVQFVVTGTLSASIDNLVTVLNASVNALVSVATYSKTDANSAVTMTFDAVGSNNDNVRMSSTHSTTVVTQPNGGVNQARASLNTEFTLFDLEDNETISVFLDNGEETQRKTFAMVGQGTVNLTSPDDKLPGATNQYAFNSDDVVVLQWLAGKWRLIASEGVTAT